MIGFYKHTDGTYLWVLEVIGSTVDKNGQVPALQYAKGWDAPSPWPTLVGEIQTGELPEDEWDWPHWIRIDEAEAKKIVPNLAQQKAEYEFRQTDECKTWAKELAEVLNTVPGLSVYESNGTVNIGLPNGATHTISKGRDGKMKGEQTGYPDPDWS